MIWLRRILILVAFIAVVALCLVYFKHDIWPWLEVHTGTVNESGPYYGFWSGFGSDLGEATIFVGVVAAYRHHNCHVKGCPWLGHPVEGTPYLACPTHHPQHEGGKRGVTVEQIHEQHHLERRKVSVEEQKN